MKGAGRTLLLAGAVLWGLGGLFALRINGVPAAVAWAAASAVCIAVGYAAFLIAASGLANDPARLTKVMLLLPLLRMVAAGALGWLVVGVLPAEAQASFWVCLVAAYLATLTVETGLLARLVRLNAPPAADTQGAE